MCDQKYQQENWKGTWREGGGGGVRGRGKKKKEATFKKKVFLGAQES